MVRRDGAEIRKERIQEVLRFVMRYLIEKDDLDLDKVVALLEYETGLRPDKIMEYLEIGHKIGRFELDNDKKKIRKIRSG